MKIKNSVFILLSIFFFFLIGLTILENAYVGFIAGYLGYYLVNEISSKEN